MKKLFTILILFMFVQRVFSTGQRPDFLIMGADTVPIFSNPLKQYLDKNKFDFFEEIIEPYSVVNHSDGTKTQYIIESSCWRGYVAYWRLENDSLKLSRIHSCCSCVPMTSEEIILKIFGKTDVFADWYNGSITVPKGELFMGSDMGYNAIYEYEDKLQIENGVLKSIQQVSNIDVIEQIRLDNKLYAEIPTLKDTLLFYLNKNIDWEKIDNSSFDCSGSFILTYGIIGQLSRVEYIKLVDESDNIWYKISEWRFDKKCSRKIKSAVESLSLSYLDPHQEFKIEIHLSYGNQLRMSKCAQYFKPITDKEIENYVRNQIEIKE